VALSPGTRLGRYQVAAEIGAGGMGEVYRASDPDLKRDVAIKVLPATLASDPERLTRFQREAEILASLNHPNIAIIYGLERADSVNWMSTDRQSQSRAMAARLPSSRSTVAFSASLCATSTSSKPRRSRVRTEASRLSSRPTVSGSGSSGIKN
jgi:serine/threonine protein kinase